MRSLQWRPRRLLIDASPSPLFGFLARLGDADLPVNAERSATAGGLSYRLGRRLDLHAIAGAGRFTLVCCLPRSVEALIADGRGERAPVRRYRDGLVERAPSGRSPAVGQVGRRCRRLGHVEL